LHPITAIACAVAHHSYECYGISLSKISDFSCLNICFYSFIFDFGEPSLLLLEPIDKALR
jgi:hypothetical protein